MNVKDVQLWLNLLIEDKPHLRVDGTFDKKTQDKLKAYQIAHNLIVQASPDYRLGKGMLLREDGHCDEQTYQQLKKDVRGR